MASWKMVKDMSQLFEAVAASIAGGRVLLVGRVYAKWEGWLEGV